MKYKHLFFDLDHTLWDFDRASQETLTELHGQYQIGEKHQVALGEFVETFREVNFGFWALYNHSKITKDEIRTQRFPKVYAKLGIAAHHVPQYIGDEYLERTPRKPFLIAHTKSVLDYLKDKYTLHIITNGFDQTQATKMSSSGIDHYFQTVTTSETTGHKKPSPMIFEHAINTADASMEESLMIGDNIEADVGGARQVGLDAIYFGQTALADKDERTIHITCLSELKIIL
jgi:putative hydrolase of the HAD superfamily